MKLFTDKFLVQKETDLLKKSHALIGAEGKENKLDVLRGLLGLPASTNRQTVYAQRSIELKNLYAQRIDNFNKLQGVRANLGLPTTALLEPRPIFPRQGKSHIEPDLTPEPTPPVELPTKDKTDEGVHQPTQDKKEEPIPAPEAPTAMTAEPAPPSSVEEDELDSEDQKGEPVEQPEEGVDENLTQAQPEPESTPSEPEFDDDFVPQEPDDPDHLVVENDEPGTPPEITPEDQFPVEEEKASADDVIPVPVPNPAEAEPEPTAEDQEVAEEVPEPEEPPAEELTPEESLVEPAHEEEPVTPGVQPEQTEEEQRRRFINYNAKKGSETAQKMKVDDLKRMYSDVFEPEDYQDEIWAKRAEEVGYQKLNPEALAILNEVRPESSGIERHIEFTHSLEADFETMPYQDQIDSILNRRAYLGRITEKVSARPAGYAEGEWKDVIEGLKEFGVNFPPDQSWQDSRDIIKPKFQTHGMEEGQKLRSFLNEQYPPFGKFIEMNEIDPNWPLVLQAAFTQLLGPPNELKIRADLALNLVNLYHDADLEGKGATEHLNIEGFMRSEVKKNFMTTTVVALLRQKIKEEATSITFEELKKDLIQRQIDQEGFHEDIVYNGNTKLYMESDRSLFRAGVSVEVEQRASVGNPVEAVAPDPEPAPESPEPEPTPEEPEEEPQPEDVAEPEPVEQEVEPEEENDETSEPPTEEPPQDDDDWRNIKQPSGTEANSNPIILEDFGGNAL